MELILAAAALVRAPSWPRRWARSCVRYVKIYFGMLTLAFGMVFYTFLLEVLPADRRRRGDADAPPLPSLGRASDRTSTRPRISSAPHYYFWLAVLAPRHAADVADRRLALRATAFKTIRDNPPQGGEHWG